MKPSKNLWDHLILHPFLFAVYSTLMLWLTNADQVRVFTIARPLAFSLILAVVVLLISRLLFRTWRKAALFTTFFAVLFFSYGHVFQLIDMKAVAGVVVGRHRFLLPIYLLILLVGTFFISRTRPPLAAPTRILNYAGCFLVAAVLAQIGLASWTAPRNSPVEAASAPQTMPQVAGLPERDVYYIILDAYGRQDVLADNNGPDISAFVQQLRDLGFVVQDCALSNYGWTALSLGSSLNMNYVEDLGVPTDAGADEINYWDFVGILNNSQVRQVFEGMGYQTVTFKTVYSWLDITDSDYYFDVEQSDNFFDRQESLDFHYLFLRTTAMRFLIEIQELSPERFEQLPPAVLQLINPRASLLSSRHFKVYSQNLFALEKLGTAPELPGKKFVYAHLFITHQPYVFNVDGSLRWPILESREAYYDQVRYANTRMINILKAIIENSAVPPVIILQGDHSYEYSSDRMKILNAYYLPDGGDAAIYPEISPVNSFRMVLNEYFGADYPYLADQSFYSSNQRPYQFELVPPSCVDRNPPGIRHVPHQQTVQSYTAAYNLGRGKWYAGSKV